jgi:hypothetical protein
MYLYYVFVTYKLKEKSETYLSQQLFLFFGYSILFHIHFENHLNL